MENNTVTSKQLLFNIATKTNTKFTIIFNSRVEMMKFRNEIMKIHMDGLQITNFSITTLVVFYLPNCNNVNSYEYYSHIDKTSEFRNDTEYI